MVQLNLFRQVYIIDSSALIDLVRHYPPTIKTFSPIWDKIEGMVGVKLLISHIEVLREVGEGDDDTERWCLQHKKMFLDIDDEQIKNYKKVEKKYDKNHLENKILKKGGWADPWLIALALCYKTPDHEAKIVTNENKNKSNNIPAIARKFGIESLNLLEFFKEIGI